VITRVRYQGAKESAPGVFDDEHSLSLAEGSDGVSGQPGNGRLVGRAVADDQSPTVVREPLDHPL
jgi:hypothetical protein